MHWLFLAAVMAAQQDVSTPPARPPGGGAVATTAPRATGDDELEEQIRKELGGKASATTQPPAPPPQPSPSGVETRSGTGQGSTGGNPLARLLLLPDISAIGDFAGVYHTLDVANDSPRSGPSAKPHRITPVFQELELGLQSIVDPYARADVFISFSPDGANVEEAYLTTLSLPAGLQARVGTLFSPFGRLNQQHPHVWDFADAPLAMDRLLAADNLKGPGFDVAWLAPVPWFAELHLAAQTTRPAFEADARRTLVARLQQFFDLASGTTVGVGFSGASVETDVAGGSDSLGGADLFVKIRPTAGRSYVVLQGEVFARRRTGTGGDEDGTRFGGYAQAVYRDGAYWSYGVRGEIAPAAVPGTTIVTATSGTEQRLTAVAAWLPSEFQRIRAQVAWDRLPGSRDGFEALLQVEFVIGSHGAHPF